MGFMKDFDIRIRSGGDDAITAVSELMAGRWIPVGERLPDDRTLVLAFSNGRTLFGYTSVGEWIDTLYGWTLRDAPTHWMPLPEPPKV